MLIPLDGRLSTQSGRSPDQTERPKPDTDVGCGVEFHLWPALQAFGSAQMRHSVGCSFHGTNFTSEAAVDGGL